MHHDPSVLLCSAPVGGGVWTRELRLAGTDNEMAATLEGLATAEPSVIEGLLGGEGDNFVESGLAKREYSLVRFAALAAIGGPGESFRSEVANALARGVKPEELLGAIIAAGPQIGAPRVVAASRCLLAVLRLEAAARRLRPP